MPSGAGLLRVRWQPSGRPQIWRSESTTHGLLGGWHRCAGWRCRNHLLAACKLQQQPYPDLAHGCCCRLRSPRTACWSGWSCLCSILCQQSLMSVLALNVSFPQQGRVQFWQAPRVPAEPHRGLLAVQPVSHRAMHPASRDHSAAVLACLRRKPAHQPCPCPSLQAPCNAPVHRGSAEPHAGLRWRPAI